MRPLTVLSLEQALSLPYATARMRQQGWRVIRVEAPAGDPNRRIGGDVGGGPDRRAYFIGPNVGKQAITLDLQQERGRQALHRIVRALEVDVFCCNTLPGRYEKLGIDARSLQAIRPALIWAGISAMGPEQPQMPGYDPALQALLGFMDLTGAQGGPPQLCGLPIIDLKAGDELFTQVLLALLERDRTGRGLRIDVSMARAAASWLITVLPLLDADASPKELTRSGSEHRHFVPSNAYPTADGHVYLAIGSDRQWEQLVALPAFAELKDPRFAHNQGRKAARQELHARLGACTRPRSTTRNLEDFRSARLVCAPILSVAQAASEPWLAGLLQRTRAPDGRDIRLPPLAVTDSQAIADVAFAPRQGADTAAVLRESSFSEAELSALFAAGIAQGPTEQDA